MLVPRAKPKLGEDSQHSPVKRLGISQPVGVAEQQGQVVEVLRPIATSGLWDLSSSGTENLGKDFPSLPAKPAASIQASSSDNSPGRRNGRSSPRATNSGSVKA